MKFIYGKEGFLIDQEVRNQIKNHNMDPIIYSDGEPLDDILLDASTASMFSDSKLLIIKNHPAFERNIGVQDFIDGIKGNVHTEIIFSYESEKINKRGLLVNFLLKNAELHEFKALESKNVIPTIRKIVESKGGKIDNNAAILMSAKLPEDLRIIISETEKLLFENKHININMVETSIGEYQKNDYFALSNALTNGDSREIIRAYQNKKIAGDDVTLIISQIASTLSLALLVNSYKKQGLSNSDISEKMKVHIFRIKKSSELISSSNVFSISELIKSLAKLDADIKTGKVDPENGIEIYLLNLMK